MERPYQGRAKVHDNLDELIIEVPSKKNWLIIAFMTFWLCGWLLGELTVISILTGSYFESDTGTSSAFLIIWLIGWTIGGFFAIRSYRWMIIGKELITFTKTELHVQKRGLLFSNPKSYDIKEVKYFIVNPNQAHALYGSLQTLNWLNPQTHGSFKFDYGLKTIQFAQGLDEAEAKYLLSKIESKEFLLEVEK